MSMKRLDGKVAVITGAASGMGRAMAELFAMEGASIVAGDWNAATLETLVGDVRAKGGQIAGLKGDVSVRQDCEALVDLAVSAFGRIDALVNNAGVVDFNQGVDTLDDDIWKRVMGINLDGPMYTSRRAVQRMLESGGGAIINVASTASLSGACSGAAYTASKHGVLGLTKSTAWMYAQRGIRCNAICPGGTRTNIMSTVDTTRFDAQGSARVGMYQGLMPGLMDADDIAKLALFLASDESLRINGAIVAADCGWLAA